MTENDLYEQLLQLAGHNNVRYSLASSVAQANNPVLDNFKIKINELKSILQKIRTNNKRVIQFRDKLNYNVSTQIEKKTGEEISKLTDQNNQLVPQIEILLKQIDVLINQQKQTNPNQPETMSKIYQKKFLSSQIEEIIKQSRKIQKVVEKWTIGKAVKRIQMIDNQLTTDQAEKIARQNNGYQKLMIEKSLGKASLKLKYRVDDILQKNQEIIKLNKSVKENLIIMKQIALLVQQQGQMIDNIEENVLKAKDYVQRATSNIHKQKIQHTKSRKKICCIIFIAIIILGLVTVPIVLNQLKKKTTTR